MLKLNHPKTIEVKETLKKEKTSMQNGRDQAWADSSSTKRRLRKRTEKYKRQRMLMKRYNSRSPGWRNRSSIISKESSSEKRENTAQTYHQWPVRSYGEMPAQLKRSKAEVNNRNLASMESSLTLENRESMQLQQSIKKKSMRKVSTT